MKNLRILLLIFVATLLSTQFSCAQWGSKKVEGNKQAIEETRTLSGYTEIEISGNFEVELVEGIAGKINIMAESNMLEHIVTEVQKGSLRIEVAKKMNLKPNEQIKITVPFEDLEEITMSSSGKVERL